MMSTRSFHRKSRSSASSKSTLAPSTVPSMMSSASASASVSSSSPLSSRKVMAKGFRLYHGDPTSVYPLPVDVTELNRQSLHTLLLTELLGGPVISPLAADSTPPPRRVLDLGCGSGLWSVLCHRHFRALGWPRVSFVGLDAVPLACVPAAGEDMDWTFVEHDMRRAPWPFADGAFDLVMAKDTSLTFDDLRRAGPYGAGLGPMAESVRVLRPGGYLELWETDKAVRTLHPHCALPEHGHGRGRGRGRDDFAAAAAAAAADDDDDVAERGAYNIATPSHAPLGPSTNPFLQQYNAWISRALEERGMSAVPCTVAGPCIVQEADDLAMRRCRRLAIPLGLVRWESGARAASERVRATRRTALEVVVGFIDAIEPLLRPASGMNQHEWDVWISQLTQNLIEEGGTEDGECVEVGAWSAQKKAK